MFLIKEYNSFIIYSYCYNLYKFADNTRTYNHILTITHFLHKFLQAKSTGRNLLFGTD